MPYRRCPVGVIADVDCPEFTGAPCGYFEDRGDAPITSIPRTEVPLLAAELATDYLTPRYRRRLAALRTGGAPPSSASVGPATGMPTSLGVDAAASRGTGIARGVPLNVPADRPAAPRAAVERDARESQRGAAAAPADSA